MNSALMIQLLPGWLIYIVMYAATIKILERRLTFVQSLLMSAIAAVVENRSLKKRLAAIEKRAKCPNALLSWALLLFSQRSCRDCGRHGVRGLDRPRHYTARSGVGMRAATAGSWKHQAGAKNAAR
jgi:hypothetical protein